MKLIRTLACLLLGLVGFPAFAQDIALGWPLECTVGVDCWVQQYVDHDVTPGVQDFACGAETYDGHDGTDIRVRDTTRHVNVIASSAGVVKAVRDGAEDRLIKTDTDRASVAKIECGNGVVIDHEGGWQTQYCHMRKGSVRVKTGDPVATGAALGEVGYSGMAAFPHVHLTLRHAGKVVDPFGGAACNNAPPLWQHQPVYQRGDLIETGFYEGPIEMAGLETGAYVKSLPTTASPALVAYMWAINLSAGDKITVSLRGPAGELASNTAKLDKNKAQYMLFAGKKKPAGGWPAGDYRGSVNVVDAKGELRLTREWKVEVGN